jgi:membrane protein
MRPFASLLARLEPPAGSATGPIARLLRGAWTVGLALRRFQRDYGFTRAAGLAFTTLISLIPLAVLFFSFAGILGGGDRIIAYVRRELFPLVAPDFQTQLNEWLDEHISATAFREGPTGVVNTLAVISLLLAAFGVLSSAERYVNEIWRTRLRRRYVQKLVVFWVILTASPFCIALSMTAGEALSPEGGWIDRLQRTSIVFRSVYGFIVPMTIGFAGFATALLLLPSTRVRARSAAMGGFAAAVLWEISRHAFFLYVQKAAQIASFYPKLAALPLFLVWIYLNWVIVLFGAEVSYVHQHLEALLAERRRTQHGTERSLAHVGLLLLDELARAVSSGHPPPPLAEWADARGVPPEQAARAAQHLVGLGLIAEHAEREGRFFLARDPRAIHLGTVARSLLAAEFPQDFADDAHPRLAQGHRALIDSFGAQSLADHEAPRTA